MVNYCIGKSSSAVIENLQIIMEITEKLNFVFTSLYTMEAVLKVCNALLPIFNRKLGGPPVRNACLPCPANERIVVAVPYFILHCQVQS
jgi:hypothetical protein